MERRDRIIKIIEELLYADSLDEDQKAEVLLLWAKKYYQNDTLIIANLKTQEQEILLELLYKNIFFLKKYKINIKNTLCELDKVKVFLDN